MKIKTKLVISFCIITIVPLVLASVTFVGFNMIQVREIENNYGVRHSDTYAFTNSIQLLNRYTRQDFEEIERTAGEEAWKMEDAGYLESANAQLEKKYSYLVLKKNGQVIYNGGSDNDSVLAALASYGAASQDSETGMYLDSEEEILVKQINFQYQDGGQGSAFIITATRATVPEVRRLMFEILLSVIIILLVTGGVMTMWVYHSIVSPIKKLQLAAENIKEGNLDFSVDVAGEDELGALGVTFEQMRQRLKDNTEEKINDETENRALISNIAHDLRTPITAVKGYAEGIIDGVANTPEKVDKYVRTIYNKANEMDTLINELTIYSRIDTNRIPYNFAKINAADYFTDCVEEIGIDLEAKGIGLAYYNYAADDTVIIADPEQLRRVINNIIGNSVKYMNKQHGFISIRIKDVGDFIQMELEDNGRGIAQKDLPYIFDRFYRADASRNSATGGSGIGLSIVRKIIEDHGGKIWAASREGYGTIMYFVIRKYQEVPNE